MSSRAQRRLRRRGVAISINQWVARDCFVATLLAMTKIGISRQTLINTVNCVGVMGKGIAAEFKKRYPKMFEDYAVRCKKGEVKPKDMAIPEEWA